MAYSSLIFDYLSVGLIGDRPVTPNVHASATVVYYATDEAIAYLWDGSAWQTIAGTISSAADVPYDNSTSMLVATDVQAAIDEVEGRLDTAEGTLAGLGALATGDDAGDVPYSNSTSGLSATDVQAAIDEVEGRVDTLETDVAALGTPIQLKGTWDASSGSFPGSGSALAGWSYIVSVGGTVDSVVFTANDRIVAITDSASTSTYAANWHKLDYTDQVLSVNGETGAVTLDAGDIGYTNTSSMLVATTVQAAIDEVEGRLDTAEGTIAGLGALATGDDAGDVPYDNGTSGLSATDVQAAIDEVYAAVGSGGRPTLTGNTTFYVRTDGDDGNDGSADTSGDAWLTIQHALDVLVTYDFAGFTATVKCADGTYTGATIHNTRTLGGIIQLEGNTTTPANCIISTTSADGIQCAGHGVEIAVKGFKIQTTTGGACINATSGGVVRCNGNMTYGASANSHLNANALGYIIVTSNYTIDGSAALGHVQFGTGGGVDTNSITVTLSGTPSWGVGYAWGTRSSGWFEAHVITFSGSATGPRHNIAGNCVAFTNGGGASYFPGDSSGSTATGGLLL